MPASARNGPPDTARPYWRVASNVGWSLAGLGVLLVLVRVWVMWPHRGYALMAVLQDPGKVFFHVVLLPLAALALVSSVPWTTLWGGLWSSGSRGGVLVVVAAVIAAVVVAVTLIQLDAGFCKRFPLPEDHAVHRDDLLALRASAGSAAATGSGDAAKEADRASQAYRKKLDEIRRASPCRFRSQASWYARYAAVLSFVGQASAGLVLWVALAWAVLSRDVDLGTTMPDGMVLTTSLLAFWMPLRVYSDWYIDFGVTTPAEHAPLLLAAVLTAAVFLLTSLQERKTAAASVARSVAGATGVLEFAALVKSEWVEAVARTVAAADEGTLVGTYLVLGGTLWAAVWLALTKGVEGSSPDPSG